MIFTILQAQVLIYNVISVGKLQVPTGSNKKDLIDLEFDLKCKNDMINFPQCDEWKELLRMGGLRDHLGIFYEVSPTNVMNVGKDL